MRIDLGLSPMQLNILRVVVLVAVIYIAYSTCAVDCCINIVHCAGWEVLTVYPTDWVQLGCIRKCMSSLVGICCCLEVHAGKDPGLLLV